MELEGASPVPPPFPSLARPPDGLGRGVKTLPPSSMAPGDVAVAQAALVSFFQFLGLTFPVSLFLGLSELGGGHPRKGDAKLTPSALGLFPEKGNPLFFLTPGG